jgi:hypothetical protein
MFGWYYLLFCTSVIVYKLAIMVTSKKHSSCETSLAIVRNVISYSIIFVREVSAGSFTFLRTADWYNKYATLFEVHVTYAD